MTTRFSFFRPFLSWAGFLLWAVVLWRLSALSGKELNAPDFPFADKIAHFTYFFAGAILLTRSLCETFRLQGWRLLLCVVIIMVAIGLFDEIHQLSTPGRSGGDRGDLLADTCGGLLGGLAMTWAYGRRKS